MAFEHFDLCRVSGTKKKIQKNLHTSPWNQMIALTLQEKVMLHRCDLKVFGCGYFKVWYCLLMFSSYLFAIFFGCGCFKVQYWWIVFSSPQMRLFQCLILLGIVFASFWMRLVEGLILLPNSFHSGDSLPHFYPATNFSARTFISPLY